MAKDYGINRTVYALAVPMANKKFWLGMLVMVLAFGMTVIGCESKNSSGGSSALVGKWVPEDGQRVPSDFIEKRVELLKDGTGIGDGYSLTWTVEKSRIVFKLDRGYGFAYDYQVSGSALILTNDDGKSVRYKKEQ